MEARPWKASAASTSRERGTRGSVAGSSSEPAAPLRRASSCSVGRHRPRGRTAVGSGQPVQPRRRLRRSHAGRLRPLDAAAPRGHAPRRQRHEAGALRRPLRDRRRPGLPDHRPPRQRGGGVGGVAHRPRGDRRTALGPLVLVPLQVGAGDQRRRPDPHRAAARRAGRQAHVSRSRPARTTCGATTHAYADLAANEDLELVVHLGDYIYENGSASVPDPERAAPTPAHPGPRGRVALGLPFAVRRSTSGSRQLQAAHPLCPWLATWDDHEVEDNYADLVTWTRTSRSWRSQRDARPPIWRTGSISRLSRSRKPVDENMPIFRRRADWGALATFHVIDTRQYRADQLDRQCGPRESARPRVTACSSSTRIGSCSGDEQRRLAATKGLGERDRQRMERARQPGRLRPAGELLGTGARAVRTRQLGRLRRRPPAAARTSSRPRSCANLVVITGDKHINSVRNVPPDTTPRTSRATPVATEFIGTSISSGGERTATPDSRWSRTTRTSCGRDRHHGYVRVEAERRHLALGLPRRRHGRLPVRQVWTESSWEVTHDTPGCACRYRPSDAHPACTLARCPASRRSSPPSSSLTTAAPAGAAPLKARGSIEQAYVTGAAKGQRVSLLERPRQGRRAREGGPLRQPHLPQPEAEGRLPRRSGREEHEALRGPEGGRQPEAGLLPPQDAPPRPQLRQGPRRDRARDDRPAPERQDRRGRAVPDADRVLGLPGRRAARPALDHRRTRSPTRSRPRARPPSAP